MPDRKVVVIGGGVTGVLTARQLLLAGWEVTLLEADHIGAGSSSRTAAGIRQQFSTPGTVRGMRYAVDFYKRFASETENHDSPIVQNGYLFLLDDEPAWTDATERVVMQRSAGLTEVELLDGAALHDRFPWVREGLRGATWCPTDGFLLPHLVYNEGARRIRELGGNLVQRAPVTSATVVGDRITSVTTPKGDFEADLFIDATNAWTRRLATVLGAEDLPVDPLKRYLWFLGRDGPMDATTLSRLPLTICPDGTYVKPESGELLQMGKKHETKPEYTFTHHDQDAIEPDFSHTADVDALPFLLWERVAEALPPIGEFGGIQSTTSGFYGTTPDHNPFLGFDRQRTNLIRLVGFSGHGAMMAPFTALVGTTLAEAGTDLGSLSLDDHAVDLSCFQLGRTYDASETMVI